MKAILCASLFIVNIITSNPVQKNNTSYCVMCMNDGNILESYNDEYTQSVASISKVMTAILAIELADLNDKITVDKTIYEVNGSSLYLKENEVYTLEDLIYGLMLRSGNDAAVMIAKHISKNIDAFVIKMNEKAKALNMYNTLFHNPSGLDEDDGGNISSSCDMAKLMRYAMQNEVFRKIVNTNLYKIKDKIWINKNKFLKQYEYATGGKTGYTKNAGRTLITTSEKNAMEIVVVTLRFSDDFNFHQNMHIQMHDTFEVLKLIEKGEYTYQNKKISLIRPYYQVVEKNREEEIKIKTKWYKSYFQIESAYKSYMNTQKYEVKNE